MSYRRNFLTRLLLVSGLAGAAHALAEPGNCGPMGGWEQFHEQRQGRIEQHQKRLHDALKLTSDQEGAWQKFTESMRNTARPERANRDDWAKLTTPERAEKMLDLAKQRQERMVEHVAALKTFYAVLTPEQKKIFDEQHAGPRPGRRGPPTGDGAGVTPPSPPAARG